jgi:hypothetical protein
MHTGGLVTFGNITKTLCLFAVAMFVFLLPNSQQLLATFDSPADRSAGDTTFRNRVLAFRPTPASAVLAASVGIIVLVTIYSGVPSEFIYFQF